MRRILKSIFLLLCPLVFGAWVMKEDINIEVLEDKSVTFSTIIGFDDDVMGVLKVLYGKGQEEFTIEEEWELVEFLIADFGLENKGFKMEHYEEENFRGLKYTKNVSNIDDITEGKIGFEYKDLYDLTDKNFFLNDNNNYKLKINYDKNSESKKNYDLERKLSITLPKEAISSNADKVSNRGKTLTWEIKKGENKIIEVVFDFPKSGFNLYLMIAIGGVLIVILGIVGYVIMKRKGPKKSKNMVTTFDNSGDMVIDNRNNLDVQEEKEEDVEIDNVDTLDVMVESDNEVLVMDEPREENGKFFQNSLNLDEPQMMVSTNEEENDNSRFFAVQDKPQPVVDETNVNMASVFPTEVAAMNNKQGSNNVIKEEEKVINSVTDELFREMDEKILNNKR